MSVRVQASLSQPLGRLGEELGRDVAADVTAGMRAVAAGVKQDLRREIAAATGSNRFPNAVDARAYPDRPTAASTNAAVSIWPRGARAEMLLRVFSEGATIKPADGGGLAIPLPGVPRTRGVMVRSLSEGGGFRRFGTPVGGRMSPREFEATVAPLRFVPRRRASGLIGLLIADDVVAGRGRERTVRRATKGRRRQGRSGASQVMYLVFSQVRLQARLNPDRIVEDWANRAAGFIEQAAAVRTRGAG